jgi:two-component system, chemotaxis family, response regulator Rcp1
MELAAKLSHILLVEDNPGDIRLLEEAASEVSLPALIHTVTDGEQAIAYLSRRAPYDDAPTPDLILLDLNLPKVDGGEVLQFIKKNDGLKRITTILLTNLDDLDKQREMMRGLPADDYLCKPRSWDRYLDLVEFLRQFL